MLDKSKFKIGENTKITVFWYDTWKGQMSKEVEGIIQQVTDEFIVINNGKYNETFRYSELINKNDVQPEREPYDLKIENYEEDIIERCKRTIKKGKAWGYVFNMGQKEKITTLLNKMNINFISFEDDGIYYFKKIQ